MNFKYLAIATTASAVGLLYYYRAAILRKTKTRLERLSEMYSYKNSAGISSSHLKEAFDMIFPTNMDELIQLSDQDETEIFVAMLAEYDHWWVLEEEQEKYVHDDSLLLTVATDREILENYMKSKGVELKAREEKGITLFSNAILKDRYSSIVFNPYPNQPFRFAPNADNLFMHLRRNGFCVRLERDLIELQFCTNTENIERLAKSIFNGARENNGTIGILIKNKGKDDENVMGYQEYKSVFLFTSVRKANEFNHLFVGSPVQGYVPYEQTFLSFIEKMNNFPHTMIWNPEMVNGKPTKYICSFTQADRRNLSDLAQQH